MEIALRPLWDFEVWVIDNHSVTVRKLFVAFCIFVIGILGVKFILYAITRRLFYFARLKETTASSIQKILTYSAYLLVLLFALRMVNIPLTAFAFPQRDVHLDTQQPLEFRLIDDSDNIKE